MEENGAAILRAPVWSLAVLRCGIVIFPEDIQQRFVRHLCRIELDFHHFGMAGLVTTNIFVGWILRCAAGISDGCGHYSRHLAEGGLDAPKTSGAECGLFNLMIRGGTFHITLDVFRSV